MSEELTPEQIEELKRQLEQAKSELQAERQKQLIIQTNLQDKFLETLIDKGGQILMTYSQMSAESARYTMDRDVELEKEELVVINKLDTKDKVYKGVMIGICVLALILSSLFIEKAEVVIPVLSLIIGLLFKSNSLSEYFTHAKRKLNSNDDE